MYPAPEPRQLAQLSPRHRAAGCVSFGQKRETGTARQYFRDIIIQFNSIQFNV